MPPQIKAGHRREAKDSANRAENKINSFIFYPEVKPIFGNSQSSANRAENKINSFIFYPEVKPIFGDSPKKRKPRNKITSLFIILYPRFAQL